MAQEEDIACIESIAKIVSDLDLESVDYNKDGLHIIVTNRSKEIIAQPVAPAPLPAMPVPAAPAPAAAPYVKVGDTVKEGDVLCLIEAMKTFNQIKAPRGGIIREILAASGAAVEFDEPLFVIE